MHIESLQLNAAKYGCRFSDHCVVHASHDTILSDNNELF